MLPLRWGSRAGSHIWTTLKLIPVAFKGDAHQLASCSDAGFCEELLQGGFYSGFRAELIGDLLVGEAFEDKREHFPFSLRQLSPLSFALLRVIVFKCTTEHVLVEERFPLDSVFDPSYEGCGRAVF